MQLRSAPWEKCCGTILLKGVGFSTGILACIDTSSDVCRIECYLERGFVLVGSALNRLGSKLCTLTSVGCVRPREIVVVSAKGGRQIDQFSQIGAHGIP